jgi:hypothetical protein
MKKLNMFKIGLAILLSAISLAAQAQFAVSVTAGSADYKLEAIEGTFVDAIDDSFLYRDLGIDYSWGNHQVGLKIGGLAESNGAIDIRSSTEVAATVQTGDAERDELSVFYTYRTNIGVALTGGYYTSEVSSKRKFTANIANYNSTGFSGTFIQNADKKVENDGFFFGAAYGRALSDRTGIYARLGYQDSDVEEKINLIKNITIPVQTGLATAQTAQLAAARSLDLSGDAVVYGVGGYWAVTDTISLNLFYEVKDFDYSLDAYADGGGVQLEEEQDMIGLTLRYSL